MRWGNSHGAMLVPSPRDGTKRIPRWVQIIPLSSVREVSLASFAQDVVWRERPHVFICCAER